MTWFALYTRPHREARVTEALLRKNIQAFCPMAMLADNAGSGQRDKMRPLFPSIVFVRVEEGLLADLRMHDGVINALFWQAKPVVIQQEEIEALCDFLTRASLVTVTRVPVDSDRSARPILQTTAVEGAAFAARPEQQTLALPSLGFAITATLQVLTAVLPNPVDPLAQSMPANRYSFG